MYRLNPSIHVLELIYLVLYLSTENSSYIIDICSLKLVTSISSLLFNIVNWSIYNFLKIYIFCPCVVPPSNAIYDIDLLYKIEMHDNDNTFCVKLYINIAPPVRYNLCILIYLDIILMKWKIKQLRRPFNPCYSILWNKEYINIFLHFSLVRFSRKKL